MIDFGSVCRDVTLWFEGGLVDDPDDPGGLTNFGITQSLVDDLKLKMDVRTLTIPGAVDFYQDWFWKFYHCDLLSDQVVAAKLFDMLVNMTDDAVLMVQSALNLLYDSPVVVVDGKLGSITANYINHIESSQMRRFLLLVKRNQRAFYLERVTKRPVDKKFLDGWLRRAYWPYMDDARLWPYLPRLKETWPEGVE
jgi:type VI secretion system secreted protein VgrG